MEHANVKRPWRSILLLTLPFLLPSCSDTPTSGNSDEALTRGEALALAGQLGLESLAFGQSRGSAAAVAADPGATPSRTETVSVTYSLTRPCLLGGTVDSSGKIRVETDTVTDLAIADVTATEVHHDCVFLAGGTRVAVSGDPSVTATIHAASLAGHSYGTQSVSVVGGLRWVTDDGRSGRCTLDILVEADESTMYSSTRGEMCGFVFDVTVNG